MVCASSTAITAIQHVCRVGIGSGGQVCTDLLEWHFLVL